MLKYWWVVRYIYSLLYVSLERVIIVDLFNNNKNLIIYLKIVEKVKFILINKLWNLL